MSLTAGTQIGPYQVVGLIGQGGMGEVYRAKDTKLGRDVALKVLPDLFADDPERLARFQREARVLASLNHPNIASIYGLEESEGVRALVLELVEGPTLAERIAQGAIPVEEALPIAKQIADAIEAAHEAGVIHRDLKPANVKVKADGMVKVLDFGLAKALEGDAGSDPSESPTLTAAATRMGVIMGTAAYMSPEQARGKTVDKRADIWAFGVVLYEMLTGQRPFKGRDVSETLAAAMMKEPDWPALPANLPAPLGRLLRRCLDKEPRDRLRDVGDARAELRDVLDAPSTTNAGAMPAAPVAQPAGWRQSLPWVAALVGMVGTGLLVWILRPSGAELAVSRLTIAPPPGVTVLSNQPLVSPDGRRVVFAGVRDGVSQLYLRDLDELDAGPVPGSEGAAIPQAFSPDGQDLLYMDSSGLVRLPVTGGRPMFVADNPGGAAWGVDDIIVFAAVGRGTLHSVSASGGEARSLTTLAAGEAGHIVPRFLPNGHTVLFYSYGGGPSQVEAYDLVTGVRTTLLPGTSAVYVPTGHLVFWRDGGLWAVPFDPDRVEVTGTPVEVVENVASFVVDAADYAISDTGTLVYFRGGDAGAQTLAWVDRDGREEPLDVQPRAFSTVRLSPDGRTVAFAEPLGGGIWTLDLTQRQLQSFTGDDRQDSSPLWSLDSRHLLFWSSRDGHSALYRQAADGAGIPELLVDVGAVATSIAPDGTQVLVRMSGDVSLLHLDGTPQLEPLLNGPYVETNAEFSPDGRWLAYESNESGQFEVYVRPFPNVNATRAKVSVAGGTRPLWSRDGRELFYWADPGIIMAVPVQSGEIFRGGVPASVVTGLIPVARGPRHYDVSPNGRRFLVTKDIVDPGTSQIVVVQNWHEELKRLVPVD